MIQMSLTSYVSFRSRLRLPMVVEVVIVEVAVVDVEADVDLVATGEVLAAADMVVVAAVVDVMVIAKEDTGNFKFCFLILFCLLPF